MGTNTPSYLLDVNGTARTSKLLVGNSNDTRTSVLISTLDMNIGSIPILITLGKSMTFNNQFEIGYQHISDSSINNRATLGFFGNNADSYVYILASGNMGIGTVAQDRKLEINSPVGNCLRLTYNDSDGNASICADLLMGSNGNLILNPTGSFVTSNKTIQSTRLGLGFCHTVSGGAELATYADTTSAGLGTTTNHPLSFTTNSTTRITIATNGNIGIGTNTPLYPLHVVKSVVSTVTSYGYSDNGTLYSNITRTGISISAQFNNDIIASTLWAFSDRRLKYDFNILENNFCKDFVMKTEPLSYKFKSENGQIKYGYIAQDVYKAGFENLIQFLDHDGLEGNIEDDGFINPENKKMVLSYEGIIPILSKNIKNLYEENEVLKNENTELKKTINDILKRLTILESN
jgi:hypothetical protein